MAALFGVGGGLARPRGGADGGAARLGGSRDASACCGERANIRRIAHSLGRLLAAGGRAFWHVFVGRGDEVVLGAVVVHIPGAAVRLGGGPFTTSWGRRGNAMEEGSRGDNFEEVADWGSSCSGSRRL